MPRGRESLLHRAGGGREGGREGGVRWLETGGYGCMDGRTREQKTLRED